MYSIDKCDKCKEEDHEGIEKRFCRCEGRNIYIAKKMRELGMLTFKREQKEPLTSLIDNKLSQIVT